MNLLKRLVSVMLLALPVLSFAQKKEPIDTAIVSKIKDEGMNRSQVMKTLSMITDVYGPRLTNSPGYKKAAAWAKSTLESYGLQNVQYDTWDEKYGLGWQLSKFSLHTLSPVYSPIISFPRAYSPTIKKPVVTDAVYLEAKTEKDLQAYAGKIKGKIVLLGDPVPVKPGFKSDARRYDDSTLLVFSNAGLTEPGAPRNFRPTDNQKLAYAKWVFVMQEGAVAVLTPSSGFLLEDGTIAVQQVTVPYPPDVPFAKRKSAQSSDKPAILPQVNVADEHYNRMVRQIQAGFPVKLELDLQTEFFPEENGFNIIAEIPGTDLKDEVVMIGAHFDSWQGGTGATDNGAGSAVMMEAMRILKTLDKQPRRTIRIGLWGGEEQGLIGSKSYVKRTYGERLDKTRPYDSIVLKPAAEKFSVYLNMDNGTGKYRGVYLQQNENVRPVFREWLKPFNKMGASTLTLDNTGGTDHLSFNDIGLPAFQFIQDPIEYDTRTHHTTMDVYDKVIESDMMQNAVMTAAFAWFAANRDGLMPRK